MEGSVTLPFAPIGANCACRPERKAAKNVPFAVGVGAVTEEVVVELGAEVFDEGVTVGVVPFVKLGSGMEELEF